MSHDQLRQFTDALGGGRGRATYFHGREGVWDDFFRLLKSARSNRGGTIFLVQGPPGAGKSAILHEFGDRAERSGRWHHRDLGLASLYDPRDMADALGDQSHSDRTLSSTEAVNQSGVRSSVHYHHEKRYGKAEERYGPATRMLLKQHVVGLRKGLLLTLDEVQDLSAYGAIPERRTAIMDVLNVIRNAKVGGPVVLLAGGQGNSMSVLGTFGMSRLLGGCLHNLGILDASAERRVICDWIIKGGQVRTAHPRHLGRWIDAIAAETDGWPQHIHSFAPQAAWWLRRHGSFMSETVPDEVMASGRAQKRAYYAQRIATINPPYCGSLAEFVKRDPSVAGWDMRHIIRTFQDVVLREDAPMGVFHEAVRKGVLARAGRLYCIPIPSMHRRLTDAYADRSEDVGDGGWQL